MEFTDLQIGMQIRVIETGRIGTIQKIDKDDYSVRTEYDWYYFHNLGDEWEIYVPEFEGPLDALTHLEVEDYESLLEMALESNDKGWFEEICATINSLKVGEQHA